MYCRKHHSVLIGTWGVEKLLLLLVQPVGIKISAQLWLRWHFLFPCFLSLLVYRWNTPSVLICLWAGSWHVVRPWHAKEEDLIFCLLTSSVCQPSCLLLNFLFAAVSWSLGVFLSVPRQLFNISHSLSRKQSVQWDDWGFSLWGGLVVPDLTLPGSRSQGTEGEKMRQRLLL